MALEAQDFTLATMNRFIRLAMSVGMGNGVRFFWSMKTSTCRTVILTSP